LSSSGEAKRRPGDPGVKRSIEQAIMREKQLKKWKRCWKVELIEKDNPTWRDLSLDFD